MIKDFHKEILSFQMMIKVVRDLLGKRIGILIFDELFLKRLMEN